jgi:H+/Cl- antiporter ClcA
LLPCPRLSLEILFPAGLVLEALYLGEVVGIMRGQSLYQIFDMNIAFFLGVISGFFQVVDSDST